MNLFPVPDRALGLASNRTQGKKLSGLTNEGWAKLTSKRRQVFTHDAVVVRGQKAAIAHAKATPNMGEAGWLAFFETEQRQLVVKTIRHMGAASEKRRGHDGRHLVQ